MTLIRLNNTKTIYYLTL